MTKCLKCGQESPASAVRCVVCAAPLPGKHVATALLTPLPFGADDSETRMMHGPPIDAHGVPGLSPGQTFGHRYHIISLLGIGGMGAVYHVWDVELGMAVALKVIRPDSDPSN